MRCGEVSEGVEIRGEACGGEVKWTKKQILELLKKSA